MVWEAARDDGLVTGPSPTKSKSFRLPRVDNERQRYLTQEEESRLLQAIKARSRQAHDMAVAALDSGLRFGELAALTWASIDLDKNIIQVLNTKSGRDRYVPITDRLATLFRGMESREPSALVFPNSKNKKHQQVPSSFKRGIEDAKLNQDVDDPKMRVSFHSLRHTCASRLVQSGADLYAVQRILGHSTPVMTARYAKLASDDLSKAVKRMEAKREMNGKPAKVLPLVARKRNH